MIAPIAAVWIAELEDLIAELREARDACKDARAAELLLQSYLDFRKSRSGES